MAWKSCEDSLRRLDTDYLDLLQVHWPSDKEENYMTVAAMARLVRDGKVRSIGVSNFNQAHTEETLCVHPVASNQLPYALVWRYEEPLIAYCGARQVGVLAYSPLGEGILTGRYDQATQFPAGDVRNHCVFFRPDVMPHALRVTEALKHVAARHGVTPAQAAINWTARQPHITSVIVGSSSVAQVEQNAAAVAWEMDAEDEAALRAASDAYLENAPRYATMWS
jgi:aryl-alcohol dehydrogenase-like predicted oxidoreductase